MKSKMPTVLLTKFFSSSATLFSPGPALQSWDSSKKKIKEMEPALQGGVSSEQHYKQNLSCFHWYKTSLHCFIPFDLSSTSICTPAGCFLALFLRNQNCWSRLCWLLHHDTLLHALATGRMILVIWCFHWGGYLLYYSVYPLNSA